MFITLGRTSVPTSSHATCPSPSPWQTLTFCFLDSPCKWNHILYGLLCPASLPCLPAFACVVACVHTSRFMLLSNIPLCGYVVYLLIIGRRGCSHFGAIINNAAMDLGVQGLVWTCVSWYVFLWKTHILESYFERDETKNQRDPVFSTLPVFVSSSH